MNNIRIVFLVIFLLFPCLLHAETIYFKDGTSIEGRIIKETDKAVTIKQVVNPAVTKVIECAKADIDRVEKAASSKPEPVSTAVVKKPAQDLAKEKPQKVTAKPAVLSQEEQQAVAPSLESPKVIPPKETRLKKNIPSRAPEALAVPQRQPRPKVASRAYKLITCQDKSFIGSMSMKRIECTIVISNLLPDLALPDVFSSVLEDQQAAVKNLDALWVIVYNEGAGLDGLPRAYGIWSPPGGWDDFSHIRDKSRYAWDYRFLDR